MLCEFRIMFALLCIFALRLWVGTESMLFGKCSQSQFLTRGYGGANFAPGGRVVRIALFFSVFGFPYVDHQKTQVKSNQNKIKARNQNQKKFKNKTKRYGLASL